MAFERRRSGGRHLRLGTKTFNTNYHVRTPDGFVFINGDQITRVETVQKGDNWDVTFHLSDGTSQVIPANDWTKTFVQNLLADLG